MRFQIVVAFAIWALGVAALPQAPDGVVRRDEVPMPTQIPTTTTASGTILSSTTSTTTSSSSTSTTTSTSTTDEPEPSEACTPFVMPPLPDSCKTKTGSLACFGGVLYCEYPNGWGNGFDPLGACWEC